MVFLFSIFCRCGLIIFLTLSLFCRQCLANFYQEQVAPVFEAEEDTPHYLWTGGAAVASVLLAQSMDNNIRSDLGDNHLMPSWQSQVGDHYISYGINVLIAMAQLVWDRDNGMNHVRALLLTWGITQSLKFSVRQQRPDQSDYYAFPSGHSSGAFATATSLAYAYGWKVGIPAYAMATFTGLSRIADDRHWASNVVAGAFIGVICGRATFFKSKNKDTVERDATTTEVLPSYENGNFAIRLIHNF